MYALSAVSIARVRPLYRSTVPPLMSAPCPRFGFIVTLAPEEPRIVEDFQRLLSGYGLDATRAGALAFVITREGSQATNNDREIVRNWSNRWSNVASITVGDLVDLDQEA